MTCEQRDTPKNEHRGAIMVIASWTRRLAAAAALFTALAATPIAAQETGRLEADGLIIRSENGVVFIDLGEQSGVMPGDLYDIVAAEVLSHPLTGDTLAVTPKSVGAVQVRQVYERMAVGRVVYLEAGVDPMLKPISRATGSDRLEEIQKNMQRGMFSGSRFQAPLRLAAVPGMYQLRTEQRRKGWAIALSEVAALAGAINQRISSNDWKDQYDNLDSNSDQAVFDYYYSGASDRRTNSNRLFWLAGAIYLYNWIDAVWMGGGIPSLQVGAPTDWHLSPGLAMDGRPLVQLTRRF